MRLKHVSMSIAFILVGVSLMASVNWAPAGASRLGQTVPTRTPTAVPETPTPPPDTEEPPAPTPTVEVSLTPTDTPVLLPVAGGDLSGGPMLVGLLGGVLALAGLARRFNRQMNT